MYEDGERRGGRRHCKVRDCGRTLGGALGMYKMLAYVESGMRLKYFRRMDLLWPKLLWSMSYSACKIGWLVGQLARRTNTKEIILSTACAILAHLCTISIPH